MDANKKFHFSIIRGLDFALSRNGTMQIILLVVFCSLVFGFMSLGTLADQSLNLTDLLLSYINPGSSYKGEVCDEHKPWLIITGLLGMIMLGGIMISTVSNIFARRVEKIQNGHVFYHFSNHVVIMGYDTMTAGLVMQAAKKYPASEIVLQTVREVPNVRHELFSKLISNVEKNVTIVSGNRNIAECLEKLHLDRAQALFILGEDGETDRDSTNIETLKKINEILKEKQAKPDNPCFVLFENQSTYTILQRQDLKELQIEIERNGEKEKIALLDFHPFNVQEIWAQKLFVDCQYEYGKDSVVYLPLDRTGIRYDSGCTVHLVILGMSKTGIALGIQASHLCHFPNFIRNSKLKTRITFIDEQADTEMYFLQGRYRYLFNEIDYTYEDMAQPENNHNNKHKPKFTDIEWHFIKGRVEHPAVQEKLKAYSAEENSFLTLAVCFNFSANAIACGLYLPDEIYDSPNTQILVKQNASWSILSMLNSTNKYRNVKPFGMSDNLLDLSKHDDLLPIIVNYIYSYYYDHVTDPQSIASESELEKSWKTLSTVKKWSNRYNADMLAVKRRSFDIRPNEALKKETIELLAKVEHNRWNIEELLLGYRPTTKEEREEIGRDKTKKDKKKSMFIHNDLCPYSDIPDMDDKIKNTREYDICLSKAISMIYQYVNNGKNENV
ncbi:hypothetical protein AGMMS49574_03860 [Bacteroidia bacterium]|nr:hypothetical protein AGMMS49574_03860 [Bacteroidia bacterium]